MAKQYVGPKRQKRKLKDGTYVEYGNFRGYHPGLQQIVDLGTRDLPTAERMLISFHGNSGPKVQYLSDHPEIPTEPRSPVIDFDAAIKTSVDRPEVPVTSDTLLNDWAAARTEPSTPFVTEPSKPQNPEPVTSPFLDSIFKPETPKATKTKKGQLDPEVAAKTALGLKKVVTNLNCYVVGGCVSMFGRVPAQLDDDAINQLELAWGLYLEELLGKSQAKPWMFVLLANLSVGVGMYMEGTPKKKELKTANSEPPASGPGGLPLKASDLPSTSQPRSYESGKVWK